MSDPDIKVRIASELSDIQRSLADLRSQARASGRDASAASRDWSGFGRTLDGVQRRIVGIIGAYVSFRGVQSLFRGIIRATGEYQDVLAQVEARVRSTGGAAGVTTDQLAKMAGNLQNATTFDDAEILRAQSVLLSFTRVTEENFEAATEAVLNLSTAMGTDLQSSVTQIGKALNDPIQGITALQRSGIQFTAAQRQMIRSLVETGQVAEAQRVILGELETQFGGSARAARDTLGGALAGLRNAFGELLRADDGLPGVVSAIDDLTDTLQDREVREGFAALVALFAKLAADAARAAAGLGWFAGDVTFLARDLRGTTSEAERLERQLSIVNRRLGELDRGGLVVPGLDLTRDELEQLRTDLEGMLAIARAGGRGTVQRPGQESPAATLPAPIAVDPRIALRRLEGDLQAAGTLLADELRRLREGLDRELEQGLLSYSSYFQRRAELELQQVDQTLSQRRNALTLLSEEIRLLEERGEETEQQENRRKQLVAEITVLERQRADIAVRSTQDQAKAERDLARELEQVAIRLQQLQGDSLGARGAQLEREFEELIKRLEVEGDAAGVALVRRLVNVEMAKAELDALQQTYARAMAEFSREEQRLQVAVQTGVISEMEARRQVIALYERTRGSVDELIPRMRELSAVTGDPEDIERVKELVAAFERLGETLKSAQDLSTQLVQGGLDGLQRGTKELLMNLENVEGIGDAWRSVARVIVNALRDILAEMIAVQIRAQAMGFLTTAFGGAGAAAGTAAAGMATGGLVEGPGTPTSDSILARLSTGEYVTRAKAVASPGVLQTLEHINRTGRLPQFAAGGLVAAHRMLASGPGLSRPLPRYAQGGQVSGVAGSAVGQGSAVRIINALSPDLIADGMGTPAGERAVVNIIERNAAGISRMISRG